MSQPTYIQTVCALRFFYTHTLSRKISIDRIPFPRRERKLPLILSREEVKALLEALQPGDPTSVFCQDPSQAQNLTGKCVGGAMWEQARIAVTNVAGLSNPIALRTMIVLNERSSGSAKMTSENIETTLTANSTPLKGVKNA